MRNRITLIILLCISFSIGYTQTVVEGNLFNTINTVILSMPLEFEEDYFDPSPEEQANWTQTLNLLLDGQIEAADNSASLLDYDLIAFTDVITEKLFYVLTNTGSNYWGTYVYNPDYCTELVIQSPHPRHDFRTGQQGIFAFRETNAMFFCLAGTHRCNSMDSTSCSGKTNVCSDDDVNRKFKISDMAHNNNSIFQLTTDILYQQFNHSYFISLHGFSKGNNDPYVVMSNGTREAPSPDYISILADNLVAEDNLLTFKIGHIDEEWDDLLGFTNTQGRLINGTENTCNSNAENTSGRFIHMEQEKFRLRNNQEGWEKVANAIRNTFAPCNSNGLLPVELINFQVKAMTGDKVLCNWSTASELNNAYFEIECSINVIDWKTIEKVKGAGNSVDIINYSIIDQYPNLGTSYYRIKQVDFDGTTKYSAIKSVNFDEIIHSKIQIYPNPVTDQLNIVGNNIDLQQIRIYNLQGQDVTAKVNLIINNSSSKQYDLTNLSSGLYLLNVDQHIMKIYKL